MTGNSKAFDAAVYFAVALGVFALSAWAGVPVLGLIVGLVLFVLSARAALSRSD
jgi:hypothetical protein